MRDAGLGRGAPYGYAFSTVEDIDRLLRALGSGTLLPKSTTSGVLLGSAPTERPDRWAGFGMFRERHGLRKTPTSSGAGPGISAWCDFVPAREMVIVVLANQPKPAAHRVGRYLRAALVT
jgi:CubicO group peptidase (beta-lactamase class C family)